MILKIMQHKRDGGYSLVELITAVGVIAAVGGLCLAMVGRIKENSEVQKLKGDLATLNRAAAVYLANGGAFEATTNVDSMLAKLKTYPLSTQRQTIVGLRGPMVDMRVKAVPMTMEEQASGRPRVVWNADAQKLALVTSGPGIKEFILGMVPPIIEEVRKSTVEYASVSDWVWDYGKDGANNRPDYSGDVSIEDETPVTALAGSGLGGSGAFNGNDYRKQLQAPVFGLPGGFYEYHNFPLALTLENLNGGGASQIFYRIGSGGWELYQGGELIIPGDHVTVVQAFCSSADPDFWKDSERGLEIYETLYISGTSGGRFESPAGSEDLVYSIEDTEQGSIFHWGTPAPGYTRSSSLQFDGSSFEDISPEQEFVIGTLTYYNGTVVSGTGAAGVELELDLDLTVNIPIATEEITFTFELINTPNYDWQSNDQNADYVVISAPREEFTTTYNGVTYYINLSFGQVGENGFTTIDEFHVWENREASGTVIAKITTVAPEELDDEQPSVELWTRDAAVNGQFEVHAEFSEVVNGFMLDDVVVANGAKASLSGNGMDFSFFVTPSADGLVTVKVPSGRVTDNNGNPNTASNLLEVIADLTAPRAAFSYDQPDSDFKNNNGHGNNLDGVDSSNPGWGGGGPNAEGADSDPTVDDESKGGQDNPYLISGPITLDIYFDEPVSGLAHEDFMVTGALLSGLQGSGSIYSAVLTPDADAGMVTVALRSGAVSDGVGNGSLASETFYLAMDDGRPGVHLGTATASVEGSFIVEAITSERAYGFEPGDVVVGNGVASEFRTSGNGRNFSFRVTPQSAGYVTVSVPDGAFADDALNASRASAVLRVSYTSTSYVDFNNHAIDSYGGWQDQGQHSVQDNGGTLFIRNNAWKSIAYNVTVTPETVLEFEFFSDKQGEIHGIGLDDDAQLSSGFTFRVYGDQDNWGIGDYDDYSPSEGWKSYSIPVGQFYTGAFNRMVFVTDHDGNPGNGRSKFRNVRVYNP